jgi:hypothetical protein
MGRGNWKTRRSRILGSIDRIERSVERRACLWLVDSLEGAKVTDEHGLGNPQVCWPRQYLLAKSLVEFVVDRAKNARHKGALRVAPDFVLNGGRVGILGGEEMDALEEAVVDLQEEVMALRQVVTLLLAQHAANSPNALPGLRALLNESIQCDDETQMEGVKEQINRIIDHAQNFVDAVKGSKGQI